jgi:hypothetical protein
MHWTQHPEKRPGLYRFNGKAIEVLDKGYQYPPEFEFVHSEAPAGGPFPGVRSPWYDRECKRKGSTRAVAMDLDIDAAGSVSQFADPLQIRDLKAAHTCEPCQRFRLRLDQDSAEPVSLIPDAAGPIKLWVRPKQDWSIPEGHYGAGADISTGSGATNSCFSIGNSLTREKVLEYATPNVSAEDFAAHCVALCRLFKDSCGRGALLAWEHNGPGQLFGKRVLELRYRRIYYRESIDTGTGAKKSDQPGWFPLPKQKRILLEDYRAALYERQVINHSAEALREFLEYRYNRAGDVEHPSDRESDDPTGARVNHGDRVIADALMWKMMKQLGFKPERAKKEEETRPSMMADNVRIGQELFGTRDGRREWAEYQEKQQRDRDRYAEWW